MSLENVYQKLRKLERTPLWKFLLFTSILPATVSMALVYFITPNPPAIQLLANPLGKFLIFISFMTMYMVIAGGSLAIGIMSTLLLLKLRNEFHSNGGRIIGRSLATNARFLYDLAQGLFPHIIGFIKSYNDPKFEALETRITSLENDKDPNALDYNRIITDQRKIIFEQRDLIRKQKEVIEKLLPEQAKVETEENDAQTIKKDNRFESI